MEEDMVTEAVRDVFEKEKQELLKKSTICLWIESYDDIFSDFDHRPYYERALSQDFLEEARRASRDKEETTIGLNFLMDRSKRSAHDEETIKRRLHEHFRNHYTNFLEEKKGHITKGVSFALSGTAMMFIAAYFLFYFSDNLMFNFLIVIMEPGGWFLFWEGLRIAIFESKNLNPQVEFYKKMSLCKIAFMDT
jgi:hypothetical protein